MRSGRRRRRAAASRQRIAPRRGRIASLRRKPTSGWLGNSARTGSSRLGDRRPDGDGVLAPQGLGGGEQHARRAAMGVVERGDQDLHAGRTLHRGGGGSASEGSSFGRLPGGLSPPPAPASAAAMVRAKAAGSRGRSPSCTRARSSSVPAARRAVARPAPSRQRRDQRVARIDLQHRQRRRVARPGAAQQALHLQIRASAGAASTTALSTSRSVARTSETSSLQRLLQRGQQAATSAGLARPPPSPRTSTGRARPA